MDGQVGWGRSLDDDGWRKGPWTAQEDKLLTEHVNLHGEGKWNSVSKLTGLRRSGKSCRLRWVNYLRPDLKRGNITPQEEIIIQELHALWGNRWSAIARSLPGRTDNEIKNYWRTHFKKSKPSKNVEKARARFVVRQQQVRQKQKEKQLQQQQYPDDDDELRGQAEMKQAAAETNLAEDMQELMAFMDHIPYWLQGGGFVVDGYVSDGGSSEGGSWGCLWNLDDSPDHLK